MKRVRFFLYFIVGALIGILATQKLPSVQERIGWRWSEFVADVKYAIDPPAEVVFRPEQAAILPTPTKASTYLDEATLVAPSMTPMAAVALPKIPTATKLAGFQHEYQTWNNCGPATLSMALSFWKWYGNQKVIAAFTKPNPRDKNVMPAELVTFVKEQTKLRAITRVGGNVQVLKQFLASGFPVIVEKGFELPKEGWMGHYALVTAYDDSTNRFTFQDSYVGPDQTLSYKDLERNWRAFNFTYLVVYPVDSTKEIETILGPDLGERENYEGAADKASTDIDTQTGRDLFFSWFNRGTNLTRLQDYTDAARAFDQAFAVYATIPEKQRPWRTMWYQTGPYEAYIQTTRYQDVINLATKTLDAMSEPVLEESYYWRARARVALGDTDGAIKDLQISLEYHPGFELSLAQLAQLQRTP